MSEVFDWKQAPKADFAVIGDPVGHSLSPRMHQAWLDAAGIDKRYVAIRIWSEELEEGVARLKELGYIGLNATLPHKERLADFLPQLDGFAQRAGAVNTVDLRTMWGCNTDAPGFLATLDEFELAPGARIHLLGAGGSARAIALALSATGFRIRIWNRTRERAAEMAESIGIEAEIVDMPDFADCAVAVNCTAGASPVELPICWDAAPKQLVAYDLMYGRDTPFLEQAKREGRATRDGLGMLVEQGALAMEMWLGEPVDRSVMLAAVEQQRG